MRMDINCDMGESFGRYTLGRDGELIRYVTSVNIACGFHAGDPQVMARTVALAKAGHVGIGAHPAFNDLQGFGRRRLESAPGEITNIILYQVGALWSIARAIGVRLSHVKPHGALYNLAVSDESVAREIVDALRRFDPEVVMVCLAGSAWEQIARGAGLRVAREAFPDRAYLRDGSLAPRKMKGAVIDDVDEVVRRALMIARGDRLSTLDGGEISVSADTLSVHGDSPGSVEAARGIRLALENAGVQIASMGGE